MAPVPSPPPSCPAPRFWRWLGFLGLAVAVAVLVGACRLQPFLAPVRPVDGTILVLEGWLPDYALEAGLQEFNRGTYQRVFTTGGRLPFGDHLSSYSNYANVAAATLVRLGLSSNLVTAVPAGPAHRNRTFLSAIALRDHCRTQGIPMARLNLVSLGAHARRSQLCFQRALGPDVAVGVIAIENREYDPSRWWRYSQGVKDIGGEILAWTYAWLTLDYGD